MNLSILEYDFIDDEFEIKAKINSLDKDAKIYLMQIHDLYIEDLASIAFYLHWKKGT